MLNATTAKAAKKLTRGQKAFIRLKDACDVAADDKEVTLCFRLLDIRTQQHLWVRTTATKSSGGNQLFLVVQELEVADNCLNADNAQWDQIPSTPSITITRSGIVKVQEEGGTEPLGIGPKLLAEFVKL